MGMDATDTAVRRELQKTKNPVAWVVGRWQASREQMRAEKAHLRGQARMRLLATELALRGYRGGTGAAPQRLEELVPGRLQRVPLDPFSGQTLVYRAQGTNWLLYSFGPDGVDDGGKPMTRGVSGATSKGDMFYDSP